jgi:glycosyltransferase involved in cell wall biosynthesis
MTAAPDSTPSAIAGAAAEMPEIRILRNEPNAGIPATMKRRYAEARGDWVFFTPADGQVPVTALEVMWSARVGQALMVGRRTPRKDPLTRIVIAELYSFGLRGISSACR